MGITRKPSRIRPPRLAEIHFQLGRQKMNQLSAPLQVGRQALPDQKADEFGKDGIGYFQEAAIPGMIFHEMITNKWIKFGAAAMLQTVQEFLT